MDQVYVELAQCNNPVVVMTVAVKVVVMIVVVVVVVVVVEAGILIGMGLVEASHGHCKPFRLHKHC